MEKEDIYLYFRSRKILCKAFAINFSREVKLNHPQYAKINSLIAERKKEFSEAIFNAEKFGDGKLNIDELIKKVIDE